MILIQADLMLLIFEDCLISKVSGCCFDSHCSIIISFGADKAVLSLKHMLLNLLGISLLELWPLAAFFPHLAIFCGELMHFLKIRDSVLLL